MHKFYICPIAVEVYYSKWCSAVSQPCIEDLFLMYTAEHETK